MKLRTFLAIDLNQSVRQRVSELMSFISSDTTATKWVEPESLHVTVKFLGDVDDVKISDVCRSTAEAAAAHRRFDCHCRKLGAFPRDDRPRTIWVGVDAEQDELLSLHRSVDQALSQLGFRQDARRFHPHITIGRVRGGHDCPILASAISSCKDAELGSSPVDEITVYSSELTRQGPIYTVLAKARLGAANGS